MPDVYRGPHRGPGAGARYAESVADAAGHAADQATGLAAFFCESALGCGGQIILPPGYLKKAFAAVRATGGVTIADEVQTGFGRAGSHFWMFETQDAVPDIVTMGKPIGNGHPMGAVVTTAEIAASFSNGMEYFNTFGGNPVSCAVGLAVLDVIRDEALRENALSTGEFLLAGLRALAARHPIIGDVRGLGLFLGFELVRDPATREPAAAEASALVDRMKDLGVLLSTDGPFHNVIKIKPPMVFSRADAGMLLDRLDAALS
jgi:4-aminobutyrate aminotransferase-like enzyme